MKLTTITLASALVLLSSTFALAHTTHHPGYGSGVRTYQGYRGPSNSYGPYNSYGRYRSGGLNGTADGPTDLVGGDTQGP